MLFNICTQYFSDLNRKKRKLGSHVCSYTQCGLFALGKTSLFMRERVRIKEKRCLGVTMETGFTLGISVEGCKDTRPPFENLQLTLTFPLLASCSSEPTVLPPRSNPSFGWQSGDSLGHSLSLIFVFCFECIHVALGKSFHISESQFAIYKQRQMDRAMLFF